MCVCGRRGGEGGRRRVGDEQGGVARGIVRLAEVRTLIRLPSEVYVSGLSIKVSRRLRPMAPYSPSWCIPSTICRYCREARQIGQINVCKEKVSAWVCVSV